MMTIELFIHLISHNFQVDFVFFKDIRVIIKSNINQTLHNGVRLIH